MTSGEVPEVSPVPEDWKNIDTPLSLLSPLSYRPEKKQTLFDSGFMDYKIPGYIRALLFVL